ncbi:DUF6468 domain-containing protein [Azospirillum sp. TSO35-2]|uniref:DUF6468 domain-containing protein n=1 Tax=Azospirillum sp. TSO35-2 TaxID=716796 RepID=UPI000D6089B3|nr:DUF6468 domain-containing protein [Azospirillum sp. TSO35-2]PWC37812.1 hypothetical protein TSO352_10090 [Azospirillum sp. TSO35-2]
MVSFLIDAALAVMLVTATVYLVIVNKRLKLLRTGQSEINALVSTFSRSIDDTDASMKRLVASATDIATRLSDELDRAKGMKEDMTLILGSCERTATRMEDSVQHARAVLRRLDEGAMRTTRPRAPSPAATAMAAEFTAAATRTVATAPAAPADDLATPRIGAYSDVDKEPGAGNFRALELPLRATPAAEPPESPEQPQDASAPSARAAANAFYARLRTVGSEG